MSEINQDLIPALPYDIAFDCLLRLPPSTHATLRHVSQSWKSAVSAADFLACRRGRGYARPFACFVHAIYDTPAARKSPQYAITAYDAAAGTWQRLPPIPDLADVGVPLFCQLATAGPGHIAVLGGWHPQTFAVLTSVYLYSFTSAAWRRGADMPMARSFFSAASHAGKVLVAGGHDADKKALRTAEMYNLESDLWSELPEMTHERDDCKVVVVDGMFAVVSGFKTRCPGEYGASAEVFDGKLWKVLDSEFWPAGKNPSCIVSLQGQLFAFLEGKLLKYISNGCKSSWEKVATLGSGYFSVASATCIGDNGFLVSGYDGGVRPYETFLCLLPQGGGCTFRKIEPRPGFCGLMQSTCTVFV